MRDRFDEFATSLAEEVPRREALRRVGGLLGGAILASLGLERTGWGVPGDCAQKCSSLRGVARRDCIVRCDRCKRVCGGETVECREGCEAICEGGCEGYPRGKRRDRCHKTCAQCLGTDPRPGGTSTGLCYTGTPPRQQPRCCCSPGKIYCPILAGGFTCCEPNEKCEVNRCVPVCPSGTRARRDAVLGGDVCEPVCNPPQGCPISWACCPDGTCRPRMYGNPPAHCCPLPDGSGHFACGEGYSCCYPSNNPNSYVCCPLETHYCCPGGCQGTPCS